MRQKKIDRQTHRKFVKLAVLCDVPDVQERKKLCIALISRKNRGISCTQKRWKKINYFYRIFVQCVCVYV